MHITDVNPGEKMKKLSFAVLATMMLFSFTGCKKDEAPAKADDQTAAEAAKPEAKAKAIDCATVSVDSLKGSIKDKTNVTVDEYASILESLRCCKISEKNFSLDKKACVTEDALKALKADKAKLPALDQVAPILAKSDSALVRARAYASFAGLFGASDKDLSIAKEAMKNEKDAYALKELTAGLMNEGNKDADVAKFLLDMAKHENKCVREKAAAALGNSWSDKVEGASDAVIALMSDSEESVVKAACSGAGKLNDEKVIDPIVKILNDSSKSKVHSDCVKGLSTMWLDYPFHKNHNENAYKATMDYFKKSPRTNDVPVWSGVAAFNVVANSRGEFDNWKKEATWFKMDEFAATMTELVKDENFNWLGKGPAMKAIASFGGKAELEKLGPVVEGMDKKVVDSYKKELDSAK